jgi:hypothetical protein
MKAFVYVGRPTRVVFGRGSLQHLAREIEAMGAKRALVLSTPEQRGSAERVVALLGSRSVGVFDRAVMHVPIETARAARETSAPTARWRSAAAPPSASARRSRSIPACPSSRYRPPMPDPR